MKLTKEILKQYADWTPHILNHVPTASWKIGWEREATGGGHAITSDTYSIVWKELDKFDIEVQNFIKDYEKKKWEGVKIQMPEGGVPQI